MLCGQTTEKHKIINLNYTLPPLVGGCKNI